MCIRDRPDTPLERGALLCAMRTAQARGLPLFIMTTGLLDEAAQGFIGRMENLFASPISADTLLAAIRRAGRLPSDEAVARYALDVLAQKQVRTSFFKTALSPGRARIYLLSGALMLVLSFFVVFPTYYRIVGALSLGLGVASILRREAQITTRRHAS